jgi:hypothetical protein
VNLWDDHQARCAVGGFENKIHRSTANWMVCEYVCIAAATVDATGSTERFSRSKL